MIGHGIADLIGAVFARGLRILHATWRLEPGIPEALSRTLSDPGPLIVTFWHGDMLALFPVLRGRRATVAHSDSFRGKVIARIARAFGHEALVLNPHAPNPLQGFRAALDQADRCVALAVDGPDGPARVVKPGAVMLATQTGARLLPVRVRLRGAMRLRRRWDRLAIPLPFARIDIAVGQAIKVNGHDRAIMRRTLHRLSAQMRDDSMRSATGQAGSPPLADGETNIERQGGVPRTSGGDTTSQPRSRMHSTRNPSC